MKVFINNKIIIKQIIQRLYQICYDRVRTDLGRPGEPKLLKAMTAMFCCLQKSTSRCWSKYGCNSICVQTQTHRGSKKSATIINI